MRLPDEYREAIRFAAREAFGATAVVRLFGSRVHDRLRGGDIDLHIEADAPADRQQALRQFEDELFSRIERQKVDVIMSVRGETPHGFELIGYRDGIIL